MSISFYEISIPVLVHQLTALSNMLGKAAESAAARNFDGAVLVNDRLAPDMFPLSKQVQIACDIGKRGVARLADVAAPGFDDVETTLEQLQERISRTLAFIESIAPAALEGDPGRELQIPLGAEIRTFTALGYLTGFILPNVYFHASTAYAILRQNGVPLGKRDFLGA